MNNQITAERVLKLYTKLMLNPSGYLTGPEIIEVMYVLKWAAEVMKSEPVAHQFVIKSTWHEGVIFFINEEDDAQLDDDEFVREKRQLIIKPTPPNLGGSGG